MSEQADGFMISDRQVEEEGGGMHQAHEKIHNSVFISNSNISNNHSSNPFADDELLTWLQYLLDDACPDVFQHCPPPFPSPAATGGSSSSSFAVKYLPHQEDEAWMVARDLDKRAAEGWINKDLDRKTDAHLKQFFQEEASWAVKDASEQRAGGGHEENPSMKHRKETAAAAAGPLHLDHEEGAEEERDGGGGGKGRHGSWVGKQLDDRQGFAKDGRNLAQLKILSQQKGEGKAAKEAQVAASVADHFKRSPQEEAVWMNKDPDSNRIHTALFRHLPQDEEGPGLQKKATSQFRNMSHFAEESWLSHELHREAAAHLPQTKEGSWMKKELGRNLTAMDGTQSTSSALENPAADAALALGAGRAAGAIRPLGVEAFNKVRTALPRQPPKLGFPPSCNFPSPRTLAEKNSSSFASSILPPRIKTFGSYGSMFASQPAQQKGEVKLLNLAQRRLTKPCVGFPNVGSQENKVRLNTIGGGSNVNSSSKDIHLESSTTALLVSQDMEKLSARVLQQSSAGQAMGGGGSGSGSSAAVASGVDTIDMPKISRFSFPSQEKKAECAFSGGSQTSGSFKETVSGSKRKLVVEDSECQSEDAEGESAVNSQAGNSSSKRTRANEVHNLSERRRRNRINDKMNALRELIPNASKSNKAALLDEAIDYLKNLQLQLQVMSLRSGVSMLPMVLPPDLLHMQISQLGPVHPVGMGMSGGSSGTMAAGVSPTMGVAMGDMTYGVPTRPLSSLTSVSAPISSELRPLQSSTENDSISQFQASTTPGSVPLQFCHSHVQSPSQSISSVNMNMYLQQQQQIQEQQIQMLQQFHHHQQQQQGLHSSQVLPTLPLPQQRPHQ